MDELSNITLSLRRLPLWSRSLTTLSIITAIAFLLAQWEMMPLALGSGVPEPRQARSAVIFVLLLGLVLGTLAKRLVTRLRPLPPIVLGPEAVSLPSSPEAWRSRVVPYRDILAVGETGRQFLIESSRFYFELPYRAFVSAEGPQQLVGELRRRIGGLAQGGALLEHTELRRRVAQLLLDRRARVTQAVFVSLLGFALMLWNKGAYSTPTGMLRWGVNAPLLVRAGQWWRLGASSLLHGAFQSPGWAVSTAVFNGLAISYLGTILERVLGWQRFVVLAGVSGLSAAIATSLFSPALTSCGASGIVFGLLGAFGVVTHRLRAQLPLGLRQPLRWWLLLCGLNLALPLLFPVDLAAHAGGLLAGCLLALGMLRQTRSLPPPAGRPLRWLAPGVIALYAAALGLAVYHAQRDPMDSERQFMVQATQAPSTPMPALNDLAYAWALYQ
ncbi:MAG: rhomboid family intramembrane serine protease, partial [Sphingobacteriales bacterium]